METKPRTLLEELQALDEATKKKVLVVSSAVVMVVIVYFWLAYFNTLIPGGAGQPAVADQDSAAAVAPASPEALANPGIPTSLDAPAVPTPTPAVVAPPAGPGFFTRIGNGLAIMYNSVARFFSAPGEYVVTPK